MDPETAWILIDRTLQKMPLKGRKHRELTNALNVLANLINAVKQPKPPEKAVASAEPPPEPKPEPTPGA